MTRASAWQLPRVWTKTGCLVGCLAVGLPLVSMAQQLPAGMRQIAGRHLTLTTDLPDSPEIEELPQVFDAAVQGWCAYFQIPPAQAASWKMHGYLVGDRDRFQATGLLPADLPPFLNGYQRGDQLWMYEQPSAYYRRHLLLHEGTHGFMHRFLGGCGPPWYMEGVAEYLATHRWEDGELALAVMPRHRDEVPHWGRIRIVRDESERGRVPSLVEVMRYGPTAHLRVEPYAWCWAAAQLLDRHPDFRAAFRGAQANARDTSLDFSRSLARGLGRPWSQIEVQWQDFVMNLDYGFDIPSGILEFAPSAPIGARGADVAVSAARGWQSSGIELERGVSYQVTARGRFQVHDEPKPWLSEPDGVTLRYVGGQPLGVLLAAVLPVDDVPATAAALRAPLRLGASARVVPPRAGILFFKINDSPSELGDNRGEVAVRVVPQP